MITPAYAPTATERVLPRLALDFTTGVLDPRVTVTRALNTATRVNSSGVIEIVNANLPRFDYDPVTLAPKGLLIEEQRTNLLTYSEQFDNAAWVKFGATVVANATIAPDGTGTADALIEDTTTGFHNANAASTTYSAGTYTASVYVKAAGRSWVSLSGVSGNSFFCYFNLTGSGAAGTAGSGTTGSIKLVGNGWYRVSVTKTFSSAFTGNPSSIIIATADNTAAYTGDGTSGIFIWGAQMEAGAFPTSYIPTTTTSLTRNADVATMTGTNFSDWWNSSQGSFTTVFTSIDTTTSGRYPINVQGTGSARGSVRIASTGGNIQIIDAAGATQANMSLALNSVGLQNTMGYTYRTNYFRGASNGVNQNVDSSGAMDSSINLLQIGAPFNGTIKKISYWNQSLTDNEILSFTK